MQSDDRIRRELAALIAGNNAHEGWEEKLAGFPLRQINRALPGSLTPNGHPMTAWALLEHMRICLEDILSFTTDPENYTELPFPGGYWPATGDDAVESMWHASVEQFAAGMETALALIHDSSRKLTAELPSAPGYTPFRQVLLIADHNAYHLGQLGLLEELDT